MLSLDLFATQFEKELREGAVDDLEYRRMNDLREKMEMLMQAYKKADTDEVKNAIMKRYQEYKSEREGYMKVREQQVPSKQDPFAYVKPEPRGIGDIQNPRQKMAQLAQQSKKGPLANVGAGLKAFIKGEPEPMGEEQQLSPRALGVANFQRLVKANMGNLPTVNFEFIRPEENFKLDLKGLDLISDYYDGLENDQAKNYFIYRVLPSGDETLKVLKQLGWTPRQEPKQQSLPGIPTQGELPLQEKKKFKDDDLEAGDVKVARELQKLRAQYPAAKSDVEAVARAEIDSTERSQQQLAAIRGANEKQDALLKQLVALDQEQGREISGLDKENNSLEQRLAQVQATNDRLQQAVGTMTGNKKASAKTQKPAPQGSADLAQGGIIDVGSPVAPASDTTSTDKPTTSPAMDYTVQQLGGFANQKPATTLKPAPVLKRAAESRIKEHGGGIGPRQHWQDLMQEGQPQELIHRYLAIDAENDVDAVRAAIQAISRDPELSLTSKSRLLGQIGMIIRRHRLPIGRSYYQFMQQYMEEQDVEEVKRPAPRTRGEFVPPPNSSDSYKAGHDLGVKLAHATNMTQAAKTQMVQTQMQQQAIPADFIKGYKKGFSDVAAYIRNQQDIANAANKISKFAKFKNITPDQVQQIVSRYSSGETSPQIAPDFNLDAQQILRLIDKQANRDEIIRLNRQNRKGKIGPQRQLAFDGKQIKEQGVMETALNPKDPKDDYEAKRRALHDLSLNKDVDQQAVLQRRLDLDREAKAKGLAETVTNVKAGMAEIYRRLAPKIERHRDSFLAGQLYDELENYAELHGAEGEFKRMMNGARNRAHMEYDTNPGGFQNWFWFLPFEDQDVAEGTDDIKKKMSKLEALALAANRAGDDAKCKRYQQKIQSLKQKLSQSMAEGWSDQGNPTAYSVYIDGREWRAYKSDDHARAVAEKVRANLKRQGRDQTVTIAPSRDKKVQEDFGMPGTTIPRKSVIQGYTVFFNPKTQVVSVTRGGDSEEAAIEQARVGTPSMKNFRRAADRLIDRIESDLNEGREIQTREDFIKERDRLLRMIGIETDPANKQILKSAIRQLENRAENEGWITIQSRMVREDSDGGEAVEMAIMRRMLVAHTDLIIEFGLDKVVQAIEEVAYNVGDTDEIGSSDVSGWINQVKQILGADA